MRIKMLVMDVDGTLTDGTIYIGEKGEVMKGFNVKDGCMLKKLPAAGILTAIITGRKSTIVENRCSELGISALRQGVEDKLECLKELLSAFQLFPDEVAFIGDDTNDVECLNYCGESACPSDANPDALTAAGYVCELSGGKGCVAEFIRHLHLL